MQFFEKIDLLMNITMTSNKELANGISVDPSLISLLRTGKRKQPKNPNHIRNMAVFFAKKCTNDFQRNALAEITGISSFRLNMSPESLEKYLEKWLVRDSNIVDYLLEGIETVPQKSPETEKKDLSTEMTGDACFFFGEEGRRNVMRRMMDIILKAENPGSLLVSSDDNLEWLLSDYSLTKQIQAEMMEVIEKGFTFCQIMPAINFLPRFAESLQFWLPLYSTGKIKVYYYPRLRDNLYRRSMIIVPGHCVRISTAIGLGSSSAITMFSTDPAVVNAHIQQYQEHLSMCLPALSVHFGTKEFFRLFSVFSSRHGEQINMTTSLYPNSMPQELFTKIISETDNPDWKSAFRKTSLHLSDFEEGLKKKRYIDLVELASPKDIRAGKVAIACPFGDESTPLFYTPETYVLHLKNILRLMDTYDNYYFIPCNHSIPENYNLFVNSDGMALLLRTSSPPLILEINRNEMVLACYEHLLRIAERLGFDGIRKARHRARILELIKELEN